LEYLGSHINVQGGGSDLKFPHHEMSAAHAETTTGIEPFADVFMHTGMVALDGQKMSKSLGNLVFVSKLRAQGVDPMAIRLTILSHHYRGDWEWFDTELEDATTRLEAWRLAFGKHNGAANVQSEVLQALCNDLDTPSAIRIIDQWCEATNNGAEGSLESPSEMADCVDALLGIR
jgi:L-cysteine:1D-myo-inositol 2-amino-2-deoxy-alpha-D-glucopyranoside ligase